MSPVIKDEELSQVFILELPIAQPFKIGYNKRIKSERQIGYIREAEAKGNELGYYIRQGDSG